MRRRKLKLLVSLQKVERKSFWMIYLVNYHEILSLEAKRTVSEKVPQRPGRLGHNFGVFRNGDPQRDEAMQRRSYRLHSLRLIP